jgi:hypothetical protein
MARKRVIMARLGKLGEDDGSFDFEFWRRVGTQGKWIAAWEMVKEFDVIKGGDGHIPRLHKSIHGIERRGPSQRKQVT